MKKYLAYGIIVLAVVVSGAILWQGGAYRANMKGTATNPETFIDVRTDAEWAAGHLDGALHFDLVRLQAGELPNVAKDAPLATYCRTGIRAGQALQILQANGFTNVRNAGGFADLQAQGKKTCTGTASTCE
jgi:rhodanese-related sulfurtransferase